MSNGIPYYKVDTDRYDDIRIKKLKKDCGASGIAIYDYILCQIYSGCGYYIVEDEDLVFKVADYLNVKRQNVSEVIGYACAVGLFDREVRTRESILTSVSIQKRWFEITKRTKRKQPSIDNRYWLLSGNVVQQMPNVVQQNENVVQHLDTVVQQSGNVVQQMPNVVQQSYNIQTEKETEKENSPLNPYKEKEKEKETNLPGERPNDFSQSSDKSKTSSLTMSEKLQQAIERRKKREIDFYNSLIPFVEQYGREMIREFFDYWSEPTRRGDVMRFEKEVTWDLSRRLATWSKRSNFYENGRNNSNKSRVQSPTTTTNNNSRDSYAEISDFIGKTIV